MLGQVLPLAVPLSSRGTTAEPSARPSFSTSRGQCHPFGATPKANGVNFAVFSRHAQAVHLVLFQEGHDEPLAEIVLDPTTHRTGDVWHVFVSGLPANVLYGYRVNGPFHPRAGQRFNPRAIVLDPYARALSGGHPWGARADVRGRPARLGRIVADDFDWEGDVAPRTPLAETVLYELHVRGFTRHPSSGVQHPGTFLGLCEKIAHLKALGVTAVQLMPALEFDEHDHGRRNPQTGAPLHNYWGYSPLSFFAPKAGYAARPGQQAREMKEMVKQFHRAGLEVVLDVVYNHTAEGNENGPTLGFRGLDNALYYMLDKEGRYYNYSGCGNTLNGNHPAVREMILDSLVELVAEYHVDGFRFDLASVMTRGPDGKVLEAPPLLEHIAGHPVLAGCKLIAEPWDAAGLAQQGKFPAWGRWAELNGTFRDDVRRFVRSELGATAAVAKRICGSLDLYGEAPGGALHSINFVTCHDGFTLHDLVGYNLKHNLANGENNADGWDHNFSYNCGVEGPTADAHVLAMRQRQMRNFLVLLLVSQGVPLLLMGDELGRTQGGNNNAYCQDNETAWVDWSLARENAGLVRFASMLIALRKRYFALSREQFVHRIAWHGNKVGGPDWTGQQRTLAFQVQGGNGQPHLFALFNAHWEPQRFALPPADGQWRWRRLVDTNLPAPDDVVEERQAVPLCPGDHYVAAPRSAVLLIA